MGKPFAEFAIRQRRKDFFFEKKKQKRFDIIPTCHGLDSSAALPLTFPALAGWAPSSPASAGEEIFTDHS
jgi:hypothetical protein